MLPGGPRNDRQMQMMMRRLGMTTEPIEGVEEVLIRTKDKEIVFARPGLGSLMVGAMLQRDYTALQSIMVIYTAFVVVINLAADVTYGFVDPRIRY